MIFWLIAGFFLKFLWWDGLEWQRIVTDWSLVEGQVERSTIGIATMSNDYELTLYFMAEVEGKMEYYQSYMQTGEKGALKTLAETRYAPGQTIEVYINPEDVSQFAFPQNEIGPWLVGMVPGLVFGLIGYSVWFRRPSEEA